jgi:hypothetical protein
MRNIADPDVQTLISSKVYREFLVNMKEIPRAMWTGILTGDIAFLIRLVAGPLSPHIIMLETAQ